MEQEDGLDGHREDYVDPPHVEFDHGRESPYRYVHGAPLHNVVEEEEEWEQCVTRACGAWCVIPEIADCQNRPLLPPFSFLLPRFYQILRSWLVFATLLTNSTTSADTEK